MTTATGATATTATTTATPKRRADTSLRRVATVTGTLCLTAGAAGAALSHLT
ncbi:hypothetical protein ABZ949_02155 [Micromonospora tulbaghiae]|uniref:hypothetical protein n=1 Tax=Micromonospora tulbaghiae TaxID=479978 RepID=UPI0033D01BAE